MSTLRALRCLIFYSGLLYLLLTFLCYDGLLQKIAIISLIEYVGIQYHRSDFYINYVLFENRMIDWFTGTGFEEYCECSCVKHRYIPPWERKKVWYKVLIHFYSKHYKTGFRFLIYSAYLYLKSSFIVAHLNQFLPPEDQLTVSFYNYKYFLLVLFLTPYTRLEFQWHLFTILTQHDFTCRLQIYLSQHSQPRMSLIIKFSFWWLAELIMFYASPVYTLKVLVYGVYSLEALLRICCNS
ncbi:hypothetical protein M8J76_003976 [Diaphorina citri]|nr:hypothetical protein M8J75_014351 [Diaphorina citri]KAI5744638.1 hypothetical protein M8J76_003976 [Diaphorina citri]KAI5751103.1 hypothetical protein M8J77_004195 [Diaphorina citri]